MQWDFVCSLGNHDVLEQNNGKGKKGGFGFLFSANPKFSQKWKGKIICFEKCS